MKMHHHSPFVYCVCFPWLVFPNQPKWFLMLELFISHWTFLVIFIWKWCWLGLGHVIYLSFNMGSSLQYFLTLFLDIVRVHPLSLSLSLSLSFSPLGPWGLHSREMKASREKRMKEGRKEEECLEVSRPSLMKCLILTLG
jgi:hypothetical protein